MFLPRQRSGALVGLLLAAIVLPGATHASDGEPLALRRWPGGAVSIETHWGLQLAINAAADTEERLPRPADQHVATSDDLDHVLYRPPNAAKALWISAAEADRLQPTADGRQAKPGENALRVKSVGPRQTAACLRISVDGVLIAFVPVDAMQQAKGLKGEALKDADVLILSVSDGKQLQQSQLSGFIAAIQPKVVLLNPVTDDVELKLEKFRELIGATAKVVETNHNTLAVSSTLAETPKPIVVTLSTEPWQMNDELTELFAAMEKSCSDSQKVFSKLSVKQLNFKPANGTHTPRWNCEHMMGRQLLFFSQIFHAIAPAIPVMDLNPKQMPPDYEFAHPDWDGKEEARQMQRVSDFTRRFAYLLDGLELNKKAPGSSWPTLKALLRQMIRHYGEHTANTVKKFELPGWPDE
ncbi:DinB family protein [Fuerstiella marisgermanici]|uniref:DinB superfamily protein n=1 Tax=Fuerstiella marisgermanici TaxID=1891926 RepID=A0A1P8WD35_9PLAN|nr:DinB family protein [Fuerstiella marisgermanici]APZ91988.1 DinB superfamily protein [Fuerstiella marisgermanici]